MLLQLHDNQEEIPVYPPIVWNEFKPKTEGEILDHYYAYSAGCKTPTLWGSIIIGTLGVTAAAFAPAIGAAVSKALAGAKAAGGAAAVKTAAAKKTFAAKAKSTISQGVKKAASIQAARATDTARQKTRRSLDRIAGENVRIVENYFRQYDRMEQNGFQNRISAMTLAELQTELIKQKRILDESFAKCKKLPCDTAGCRSMGVLTARVQYVEALIKAMQNAGVKTPAEYNEKFTNAVNDGKTTLAGIAIGLPLLIILGAAFSIFKK